MGLISSYISEPLPKHVLQAYHASIKPNVYIVGHLKLELFKKGWKEPHRGSVRTYDMQAYKLVANVSKRVLGKTAYRQRPIHRKRLPNIVTLERRFEWPHLNVLIHKPDSWTMEDFDAVVREEWGRLQWAKSSPEDLYCQPRWGGALRYSFKEGHEALLQRSLSLHR